MNTEEMALAGDVASRVEIAEIKILQASVLCDLPPTGEIGVLQLSQESEAETDVIGNCIYVKPRLLVEGRSQDRPSNSPVLRIEGKFLVVYNLNSHNALTDAHFKAFGRVNGLFNAWPYWREFVQSMTVRMGLPPLTLSVFRLPDQPSHAQPLPDPREVEAQTI